MGTALTVAAYALLLVLAAAVVWRRPILALYAWIVGLAAHNAVMAALYGAGVRGGALTAIQAWKEILLAVALSRVGLDALRERRLPFRVHPVDLLALAFGVLVCLYAVVPQSWLDGSADGHAVGLALKHDLVPVAAYFLGRAVLVRREELVRIAWTLLGAAAAVAGLGLLDDFFVSISWWRDSAVVDYFHKHLGYDYNGTGGLPENFIYNTGSEDHFLRRLVSVFLGPLASAYMFVVALLVSAPRFAGGGRSCRCRRRDRRRAAVHVLALVAARARRRARRARLRHAALVAGGRCRRDARRQRRVGARIPARRAEGKVDAAGPRSAAEIAKENPGASGSAGSINEPSIHSHWISLREGVRTVIHHPQGYGLGNAGQTASRTETPIRAGESNYTEIGAETGLLGALLWTAWGLATLVALVLAARRTRWWAAAGVAAAFAAALVLAVQTDVIGDPWMGYVLWASRRNRARPGSFGRGCRSTRAWTSATSTSR